MQNLSCLAILIFAVSLPGRIHAQEGSLYRCPGNDYRTNLTASQASTSGCQPIPVGLAPPAGWVQFAESARGETFSVDYRRVLTLSRSQVRLWVRSDMSHSTALTPEYATSMIAWEVDCERREIRMTQGAMYDAAGKVTGAPNPTGWAPAFPDSIGENIETLACPKQVGVRKNKQ